MSSSEKRTITHTVVTERQRMASSPADDAATVAIHAAFSLWMAEALTPVAFGFIWLYTIFCLAHLFTLPSPTRWVMSGTALGTAVLLLTLCIRWQHKLPQGQRAHARKHRKSSFSFR